MYEQILRSWKTLNEFLTELREDQVKELMNLELNGKCREDIVERLHQRYTKLRMTRERVELTNFLEKRHAEKNTSVGLGTN
jgi:hypothetical protein